MTDTVVTRDVVAAIGDGNPDTVVTRDVVAAIGDGNPDTVVTRQVIAAIGDGDPETLVTRAALFVIAEVGPATHVTRDFAMVPGDGAPATHVTRDYAMVPGDGAPETQVTRQFVLVVADVVPNPFTDVEVTRDVLFAIADVPPADVEVTRDVLYAIADAPLVLPPEPPPDDCDPSNTGGWGAQPWGGGAWGGGFSCAQQLIPDDLCDLIFFEGPLLLTILNDLAVTVVAGVIPTQFVIDVGPPVLLCIYSGLSTDPLFPVDTAYIEIVPPGGIGSTYTLELNLLFESIPPDFSDLPARHIAFGVTDTAGPCAAFFISQVGIGYAGAFHNTPDLVLDSGFQQLPGTAPLIVPGVPTTFRVAVSAAVGVVYLYVTPTASLGLLGHQLIAVLPLIDASALIVPPAQDRSVISVHGSTTQASRLCLERWCLSSTFDIPNIPPVANPGPDAAGRGCSIIMLDGSGSFDPEGGLLTYSWRLIDGPLNSEFVEQLFDGLTLPLPIPTGFTSRLHSDNLGIIDAVDPIVPGDVLLVSGSPRTITSTGTDIDGFFVVVALEDIADNLVNAVFKILRSRALTNPTAVNPTFFPDVSGFYKFDLIVFDGSLYSVPAEVLINIIESSLPRGCTPSATFMFDYLSDFWRLVDGIETIESIWSATAQVAATELFTLWQHEYSKSIRDVQRTLTRRWLHYDLVLAEPLPTLTKIRPIWSGLESVNIPTPGGVFAAGTILVITSPVLATDITIVLGNYASVTAFSSAIYQALIAVDKQFLVRTLEENVLVPTFVRLRIEAPFPFSISSTSTSLQFPVLTANGTLFGDTTLFGGPFLVRNYIVEKSLEGTDVKEGDILFVDDIGYRIQNVVTRAGDPFKMQSIVLKDDMPITAGKKWSIPSTVSSETLNFYRGLVEVGDALYFEINDSFTVDPGELIRNEVIGTCETLPNVLAFDIAKAFSPSVGELLAEGATVLLAKLVRRTYLPISPLIVDLPALQEHVVTADDETVLRRNADFYLETFRGVPCIRFESSVGSDVWEGLVPPNRLWSEYTYIDNEPVIEANFGIPADLSRDKLAALPVKVDYLSAVRGLWYAYFSGPTLYSMRVGTQIFLGLPFAEEEGTIVEIRDDFTTTTTRVIVRDKLDVHLFRSYTFKSILGLETNPDTGNPYAVGDEVGRFAPLTNGVDVIDYVKDPNWIIPTLLQDFATEVEKYFTFTVRISSAAFSPAALGLVQEFILNIKPTYTYPVYVVELIIDEDGSDTDISVTDRQLYNVTLRLVDSFCGHIGSTIYDDARPGGGGWWNQFDTDDQPPKPRGILDPPFFDIPQPVFWAFDKEYLCPKDIIIGSWDYDHVGGAIAGTIIATQEPEYPDVTFVVKFEDPAGPFVVPAYPAILQLTDITPNAYPALAAGNPLRMRLTILGGPGVYVADEDVYELVLSINGTPVAAELFEHRAPALDFTFDAFGAIPIVAADVITLGIRIPVGGTAGPRSPLWTFIRARVEVDAGTVLSYAGTLPAGLYSGQKVLTP